MPRWARGEIGTAFYKGAKQLKIVFAIDDASLAIDHETELRHTQMRFLENCGGDDWDFVSVRPQEITSAPRADAYFIDFGGLCVGYSGVQGDLSVRGLIKKIENCPGSLFVLLSQHTSLYYQSEMARLLISESSPGSAEREADVKLPENVILTDNRDEKWDKVRAWLGVSKPTSEEIENNERWHELFEADYDEVTKEAENADDSWPDEEEDEEEDEEDDIEDDEEEKPRARNPQSSHLSDGPITVKDPAKLDRVGSVVINEIGSVAVGPINEPVAIVMIPVYCEHRPGQTRGTARFKLADCMITATATEETGEEVDVGFFGGAFHGAYEGMFTEQNNPDPEANGHYGYGIKAVDMWQALQQAHLAFMPINAQWLRAKKERESKKEAIADLPPLPAVESDEQCIAFLDQIDWMLGQEQWEKVDLLLESVDVETAPHFVLLLLGTATHLARLYLKKFGDFRDRLLVRFNRDYGNKRARDLLGAIIGEL